jgi:uncharacterized protein
MKIYSVFNLTKQVLVASEVEKADSWRTRMKGLLGRSAQGLSHGQGLWIEPCQGVHTIGMSFPIDVAYLDATGRVIRLYFSLRPFRLAALKLRARSVLELAPGTLSNSGTAVGDVIELRPTKTKISEI